VGVGDGGKCGAVQAGSSSILGIFRPEEVDRTALEHEEEEVHGTEDHDCCESGINDDSLVSFT